MTVMTFSEKITEFCEARGWNRAELARRVGVSRTTAGYWWDGVRAPFDEKLSTLAALFGVPVDYLVDDALDRPPAPSLSADEAHVLRVFRNSDLTADEAARAIIAATKAAGAGAGVTRGGVTRHDRDEPVRGAG